MRIIVRDYTLAIESNWPTATSTLNLIVTCWLLLLENKGQLGLYIQRACLWCRICFFCHFYLSISSTLGAVSLPSSCRYSDRKRLGDAMCASPTQHRWSRNPTWSLLLLLQESIQFMHRVDPLSLFQRSYILSLSLSSLSRSLFLHHFPFCWFPYTVGNVPCVAQRISTKTG